MEFEAANMRGGPPEAGSDKVMALAECLSGRGQDSRRARRPHRDGGGVLGDSHGGGPPTYHPPSQFSQAAARCPEQWLACRALDGCEAEYELRLASGPSEIGSTTMLALATCVEASPPTAQTYSVDAQSGIPSSGGANVQPAALCPAEWVVCQVSEWCVDEFDAAEQGEGLPQTGSAELMALVECVEASSAVDEEWRRKLEHMMTNPVRSRGYGTLGSRLPLRENIREIKRGRITKMLKKAADTIPQENTPAPKPTAGPESITQQSSRYDFPVGAERPLRRGQYAESSLDRACDRFTPCRSLIRPGQHRDQVETDALFLATTGRGGKADERKVASTEEHATGPKQSRFKVEAVQGSSVGGYGGLAGGVAASTAVLPEDAFDDVPVFANALIEAVKPLMQPVLSAAGIQLVSARAGSHGAGHTAAAGAAAVLASVGMLPSTTAPQTWKNLVLGDDGKCYGRCSAAWGGGTAVGQRYGTGNGGRAGARSQGACGPSSTTSHEGGMGAHRHTCHPGHWSNPTYQNSYYVSWFWGGDTQWGGTYTSRTQTQSVFYWPNGEERSGMAYDPVLNRRAAICDISFCTARGLSLCPSGKYASGSSCHSCQSGKYQDSSTMSSHSTYCEDCQSGKFQWTTGQSSCINCEVGRYQGDTGKTNCRHCESGKYIGSTGQPSCSSCGSGKYSIWHTVVHSYAWGSYWHGAQSCISCALGKFAAGGTSTSPGATRCDTCQTGKYGDGSTCEDCQSGKFQWTTGQSSCINCEVGRYQGDTGKTNCVYCESGKYQGSSGKPSCSSCGSGKYSIWHTVVHSYAWGSYWHGAQSCISCGVGKYQDSTGQSECKQCVRGRYSTSQGQTHSSSCIVCPAGKWSSDLGADGLNHCRNCAAGKYLLINRE